MGKRSFITAFEMTGEDGYWEAQITLDRHGEAIAVLGKDIDECARRAVVIVEAFNSEDQRGK